MKAKFDLQHCSSEVTVWYKITDWADDFKAIRQRLHLGSKDAPDGLYGVKCLTVDTWNW